ncbi:hypothetical protein [Pleionea mediterranea]|nr:hypothetical protein [Pleionea mediterranea]
MNKLLVIISLLLPVSVFSETLEGVWEIKVASSGKDQFPWWQHVKYPTKLEVSIINGTYKFQFTDQHNYTCSGSAMSVNNSNEIVFEFCGGLGTKSELAWEPIHHAKLVQGKLHGVVTTNQHLFNWVGERAKTNM